MGDGDLAMQAKCVRDPASSLSPSETWFIDSAKHDASIGYVFACLTNINIASERLEVWTNSQSKSKEALTRVLVAVHLVAGRIFPAAATLKVGAITKNPSNNLRRQVLGKQRRLGWTPRRTGIQDRYHRAHVRLGRS